MRAWHALMASAGLALASLCGYLYLHYLESEDAPPQTQHQPDKPRVTAVREKLNQINDNWEQSLADIDSELLPSGAGKNLAGILDQENEVISELGGNHHPQTPPSVNQPSTPQPQPAPSVPDTQTLTSTAADSTRRNPPAPTPTQTATPATTDVGTAANSDNTTVATTTDLSLAALKTSSATATPLPRRTVIYGQTFPYRLIASRGWKLLFNAPEHCVLAWDDDIFVIVGTGPWTTTQTDWARHSLVATLHESPALQLVHQSELPMDGRTWANIFLREPHSPNGDPREMMLLTYAAPRHGSYCITISGPADELDHHVKQINELLSTWRFPADNFQPDNAVTPEPTITIDSAPDRTSSH